LLSAYFNSVYEDGSHATATNITTISEDELDQDQTPRRDQAYRSNCALHYKTFWAPATAITRWIPSKLLFHWAVKLVFKPCKSC